MSLWGLVSKMSPEKLQRLYVDFPQHLRHLLAEWLEKQPWEFLVGSDAFCYNMASALLSATVQQLQTSAGEQGKGSTILHHISTLESIYQRDPLKLVATMRQILQGEKKAVIEEFRHLPVPFHQRQEELKFTTALGRLQHRVRETRLLRETLQQGTKAGQGGVQGLDSGGVWGGLRSDLFLDLCLARTSIHLIPLISASALSVSAQLNRNSCQWHWPKGGE